MDDFEGRVVLVTGGGGGIGRAVSTAFATAGARVAVAGRDPERLRETVALIEAEGGTALPVPTDVTAESAVEEMVGRTVAELGGLDVAVNNAGVLAAGPLTDLDRERWDAVIDTNLTGVWLCLKHEMRQMRSTGGGAIVNTASNLGAHLARPGIAAYAAAKAGVSALTKVAALEGIGDGIRVNAVSPGASETPMSLRPGETEAERTERIAGSVPLGRLGRPEELAAAVLWLAGTGSGFAVGHDLVLDGGVSL